MTGRPFLPWTFALSACALVVGVIALVSSHLARLPGTGFEERVRPGMGCDGVPTTSIVREPFVARLEEAPPRCVEWKASLVARSKVRAHFELTTEGETSLALDDHGVLRDQRSKGVETRPAYVDVKPGVHQLVATFRSQGGPAYLRLAMDDELEPHDYTVVAPLDDDLFFPTVAAAHAALDAPPPEPSEASALFAALALAAAGMCAWLAIRIWRGREVPRADLAIGAALFGAALYVRSHALGIQDMCWDEGLVKTGEHYVRNVVLGDYFTEAWAYNIEHLPLTKWVLALGDLLGALNGARIFAGVASAAAVSFLFAFGRVAFGRRVGVIAGALAVVLPLWVAHGRVAGHESLVLFWWCGSMLALACWVRSRGDGPDAHGDPLAAFACVFAAVAGIFSRPTAIWIVPVLLGAWLVFTRGSLRQRLRAVPLAAVAGGVIALALSIAAWPLFWSSPEGTLARIDAHWSRPLGDIEVYLGKLCLPAWHYFIFAFVAETPALLLLAAAAGVALALRPGPARTWGIVCLLWLVLPFGQSVSTLRIGAGRYVIQAWPALLLFAAIALDRIGDSVARRAFQLPKEWSALVRASPALIAFAYTYFALLRVEPYPLDYFNELLGGPAGIAARKTFEVPWWGEGNLAAVRMLNRTAPPGARVHLSLWPVHSLERLRDDLVPVEDANVADYVLISHIQYFATPPATACTKVDSIEVAGAPLVDTYHCTPAPPASPAQVGFAAMTRGAPDDAIPHFREALQHDPLDPAAIFGMGWAAHAKGNLAQAESLYVQAASRAAQTNDAEIGYFAQFDLGRLYAQQGRTTDARSAFERARLLRPNDPAVQEVLRSLPQVQ
jgi:4-amino-4-deoxy-L-arabinose transferase-like glycosyltransferase